MFRKDVLWVALGSLVVAAACHDSPTTPSPGTEPPLASPTACIASQPSPADIMEGSPVTLDASCTTSALPIVSYHWQLGDGREQDGESIQPLYPSSGRFTVTLAVEDQGGRQDTTTIDVIVRNDLEACFTATAPSQTMSNPRCQIDFDASCSRGRVVLYRWSFQGNPDNPNQFPDTTRTTTEPTTTYLWELDPSCFAFQPFDRTVTLTVVDSSGNETTMTETVGINK
jgi:PKD domain